MNISEKEIEQMLIAVVKRHGGLCLKWVCPGFAGVPDRICLLPNGRAYFIELKRPQGSKTAPRQKWWGDKLKSMNFYHRVIKNAHDIQSFEARIEKDLYNDRISAIPPSESGH